MSTPKDQYRRIKALEASLDTVTSALEAWVEIADAEDLRESDDDAIAEARGLLATRIETKQHT